MDLSNHLRHLHSLHAKQILHIESTLVNQFGYVTASLRSQDDTPTDTDDIGGTVVLMPLVMVALLVRMVSHHQEQQLLILVILTLTRTHQHGTTI